MGRDGEAEEEGIVTSTESERERAIPQTSNPGPTFAVVAGTCMIWYFVDMIAT